MTPYPAPTPTLAWLTDVLRQSGALTTGSVTSCEVADNAAFNSSARHLYLTYSADAPGDAPQRLFLKRNLPEAWAIRAGAREVAFYTASTSMADCLPMLPSCYGVAYDSASGASWLLLCDLSETHEPPVTRAQLIAGEDVPSDERLLAIVEAVAGLHAAWWEHPSLAEGALQVSEWYRDRAHFDETLTEFATNWAAFRQIVGDSLPADIMTLCEATLAKLHGAWESKLSARMAARKQLTISHGDCYLSQFLCPLPGSPDATTYLIDFHGACGDLPAMDLVFLFATFWTPEQRRQDDREQRLLRHYLAGLHAHGITDYTWEDLVADYRLSLAYMLFYPVWDAINGSSRGYWEPKLRRLAAAAVDWRVETLFAANVL